MKKCVKAAAFLLTAVILFSLLALPAGASLEDFQSTCRSAVSSVDAAIVYDMTNNVILFTKNADEQVSIASITKVLNACTAAQYLKKDDLITVGREIYLIANDASVAPVSYGETYTFEQLLHALLLPSGCDVAFTFAVTAARIATGDDDMSAEDAIDYFVDDMNRYLDKLGCSNSHFKTPDGQDRSGQYTTCRDYIRVLRSAMQNDLIRSVVCKADYACYDQDGGYHYWYTTNSMVDEDSVYYYPGAKGIKTGTTPWAGSCLAVAAERGGRTIITFVVNAPSIPVRYDVTERLLDAAFSLRMKGDIDRDSRVTPADARLALRASVGLEHFDSETAGYADADGDGVITPEDARRILRAAIGLIVLA